MLHVSATTYFIRGTELNQSKLNDILNTFLENKLYDTRTEVMCPLFEKQNSDKSTWHNYTTFYDYLFKSMELNPTNVFELGLGTNNEDTPSHMGRSGTPGASLRGFREYFPNANIYGADVDKRVLFSEDRIETFYCDQTNPSVIKKMWEQIPVDFDLLIEDGLHETFANKIFFTNSWHKIKPGGVYIIEDIVNSEVEIIDSFLDSFDYSAKIVFQLPVTKLWTDGTRFNGRVNNHDNSLAVIIK